MNKILGLLIFTLLISACSKNADIGNLPGTPKNTRPGDTTNTPPISEQLQAELEWSLPIVTFPSTTVNTDREQVVVLKNKGNKKSSPIKLTWGDTNSPFTIKTGTDNCQEKELVPNETCTFTLKYTPTLNGSRTNVLTATDLFISKSLIITGQGIGGSSGSGTMASKIMWTIEDYGYGPTAVGGLKEFDFILANVGGETSEILDITFQASSSPFNFVSGFNFCQNQTLAPGGTCKVRVRFSPTTEGDFTNILKASDGLVSSDLLIGGSGVVIPSQLAFNVTSYSFNQVLVGGQKTLDVKLRNNASVNSGVITLSWANANHYSLVGGLDQCSGQILPGGAECTVRVRFMPTEVAAELTNTLTAEDTFSSAAIAFMGRGVDPVSNNPIAFNQTLNVAEDIFSLASLTGMDPNGLPVTYAIVGNPTKGSVVLLNANSGEYRYTPDLNQTGADSFTFRVKNGNNEVSSVATVAINIVQINDVPVAQNDSITIIEDTIASINVLANDTDVEGNILTVTAVTQPAKGVALIGGDNRIQYQPFANISGVDSFTYMVSDGAGGISSAMVTVTITPSNDAPVAENSTLSINEDTNLVAQLQGEDVDSGILTYSIVTPPTHGSVVITNAASGHFSYVPNSNFNGSDSFTFKVSDGALDSNVATISLNVASVNDAPVAESLVVNIMEDNSKNFTLVASDADGDSLSYEIVADANQGAVSGTSPNLTYTPNSNFHGTDSITFRVSDGSVNSNTATITLVVQSQNDVPVAFDGSFSLNEDSNTVSKALTATDADGDVLTYSIQTQPTKGVLVLTNSTTGAYTYTPNLNANGSDSFTFKVNDGFSNSNLATVEITINPVEDLPIADNLNIQTLQNLQYSGSFTYSYIEDSVLNFEVVDNASNGTVSVVNALTGDFTYTPNTNYNGSDSFTYRITTSEGNSNTATVNILVASTNTDPVADDLSITTSEDTTFSGNLTASDNEGNVLTYAIVSQGTKGVVTLNPNTGAFIYTPNLNQNGADSFTFKVNDGLAQSNVATVSVTINAVNDIPVADSKTYTTSEEAPISILLSGSDVEGSALTYIIVSNPAHGTLSGTAPNLTYTPNANYFGNDSFTYKVNDGGADSTVVAVAIAISGSNDAPVANNLSFTTNEDTAYSGMLIATDGDNNYLNYTLMLQPTKGSISLNSTTGAFIYTPYENTIGADSFTFQVNDGSVNSNTATVSVSITAVNDLPVANNQSINVNEDALYSGSLVATDVEGQSLTYTMVANATNGVLTINSNGTFTYKPNQDYTGSDSFTFKANDSVADSNTATVSITVVSHNNLPVANNQNLTTNEDTPVSGTLVATDIDNDTLTYSIVANGAKGVVTLNNVNTGAFTYTPSNNQNGADAFTFRVNDGKGNSNTATVSVSINAVNDAPIALTDTVTTNRNTTKNIILVGTDVENSPVTYTVLTNPTKGVLTGTAPNLTYTPNLNQTGADSFTFKVNDGSLDSAPATIDIVIINSNILPVASNSSLTTNEDTVGSDTVGATDADGDALTYVVVTPPVKGSLTLNANGSYTYTPNLNQNGSDSFTFRANDGYGNSNIATVSITINPVNDAPTATAQSVNTKQNTATNIILVGTDVENSPVTYTVLTNPTKGVLTGTAPNLTYTPNLNQTGADSFTFKVNDGSLDSAPATVTINIQDLGNWFNTQWSNRRRIHINNQNFEALTDFPVMVKLDSSRIDYSKTKAGGADIRFADINGNLLSYEIERWNPTGVSTVWVKIPSITANSMAGSFFIYYGNSAAVDAQNKADVWSNGYAAVYHLEETTGFPQDSTSFNNHSVAEAGTINKNVSGKVAGAEQFSTADAVYRVNDSSSLDITTTLTIEAWVYQTSIGANRAVVTKQANPSHPEWGLFINDGKPKILFRSTTALEFTTPIPNNTWTFVAATYNSVTNVCSLISSQGDGFKENTVCDTDISATNGSLRLGNSSAENSALIGAFDEVRISNVVRSWDWLTAQHQSMTDAYLIYGSEQSHANALLKSQISTIQANGDDGEISETGTFSNQGLESPGQLPIGQDNSGNNWNFYRFQIKNSLPAGSTITNARLNIYGLGQGSNWNSSSHYLGIRGQKVANAGQVTGNNQYPGSGGVISTFATSSWGSPGLNWLGFDWNQSPNVNGIVQELVSSYGGFGVNNYMQFWIGRGFNFSGTTPDQEVWAEDFSSSGYNQATLLIEWTQ